MQVDPKTQRDGYVNFAGGQDSGRSPSLLDPNQAAELWNTTVRGGFVRPRPGFIQLPFVFPTEEIANWFETKPVQGTIGYKPRNRNGFAVWAVGGRFFSIDIVNGGVVQEITNTLSTLTTANFTVPGIGAPVTISVSDTDLLRVGYPVTINGFIFNVTAKTASSITTINVNGTPALVINSGANVQYLEPNSELQPITYMIQAEEFLIAQDGLSKPFIFDGAASWRSSEIPVGTAMAYGIGRLWVATFDTFVASDIVRGDSGTDAYDHRDAILYFAENTFLAGGGAFVAPGEIRAMAFMTSLDTSTGQGPLLIFTEEAIVSVNAPAQRELWAVVRDPIVAISLVANGASGFYSTVPTVNGDIFYRALDGIRSFYYALREYGTWGATPISTEVGNVLNDEDPELLKFTSAIVFDNRLLFSSAALPTERAAVFRGIVALDFHPISRMGQGSPPVYDGVWTGIDVAWLFKVKFGRNERAFAAVRNADDRNELWEITKNSKFDGRDGRIIWRIVTRNLAGNSNMELKRLENTELWLAKVTGQVDVTLSYRPDEYPCWYDWRAESVCADYRTCEVTDCNLTNKQPGYRTRLVYGQPQDQEETNDNKPARNGYEFQLLLQFEGYCELKKLRLKMVDIEEEISPVVN
jgi:hypothetical protein